MKNFSITENIISNYSNYYETGFTSRRFKHNEILPLINKVKGFNKFDVQSLGHSVEEREIFQIKWGEGKTKILMWSQMHGDEPTATMAIFDVINFLNADDEFNDFRKTLFQNVTLYFVPMLNPDGTERVVRENALGIDLNRDAQKLVSPESQILKGLIDNLKPEYGFNLHDQDIRWSAGGNSNPATIALLSPQFDDACTLNNVRKRAINVIAEIYNSLSSHIPNCIAKYGEDYEPRSFGDSITGWGTSVILIESGKRRDDPEKEFIRKMNFLALIKSFSTVAENKINESAIDIYNAIPSNGKLLYDVIFRNLNHEANGKNYKVDIAVNVEEYYERKRDQQYFKGTIEQIGDLSSNSGYKEFDCKGMSVCPGKIYEENFSIVSEEIKSLLKEGYTHIKYLNSTEIISTKQPLNIIKNDIQHTPELQINKPANFYIAEGKVKYTIVNGFIFDCENDLNENKNSLIF